MVKRNAERAAIHRHRQLDQIGKTGDQRHHQDERRPRKNVEGIAEIGEHEDADRDDIRCRRPGSGVSVKQEAAGADDQEVENKEVAKAFSLLMWPARQQPHGDQAAKNKAEIGQGIERLGPETRVVTAFTISKDLVGIVHAHRLSGGMAPFNGGAKRKSRIGEPAPLCCDAAA